MSLPALNCPACACRESELLVVKDGFRVVRCLGCQLVRVDNPPTEAELQRHYSFEEGYHSSLAADAAKEAVHTAEARDNLVRLQRFRQAGSVLDVGCSTGLFLNTARSAGWDVFGVEYSADSAQQARQKFGLNVVDGALDASRLQGRTFDVVTLWDVLEHVPEPLVTLAEVRKLLKPDGLLFIKTPNVDGWFPRLSLRLARRLNFWRHPEPPGHLFQFSETTLKRIVQQAGFEPVDTLHGRISITYSLGSPREWVRSLKWAVYCAIFVPLAWAGPFFGAGDDLTLVCKPAKP